MNNQVITKSDVISYKELSLEEFGMHKLISLCPINEICLTSLWISTLLKENSKKSIKSIHCCRHSIDWNLHRCLCFSFDKPKGKTSIVHIITVRPGYILTCGIIKSLVSHNRYICLWFSVILYVIWVFIKELL